MKQEFLLDSNILIYLADENPKIIKGLRRLSRDYFFISTVSLLEVLLGAKNPQDEQNLKEMLRHYAPLDVRSEVVQKAIDLKRKNTKKLKFKDLLIAATAQVEGLTLITADKDFKSIKGLKVELIKL